MHMSMTKEQNLEQAKLALVTVIDRYDCMGWFDENYADESERAEAKEMEDAKKDGDEIAVGVALDRALERYDCMGAFDCARCGQGLPQFGYMNACECGDEPDRLAEEALEVQKALETLRKSPDEGNDEVSPEVDQT